MGVVPHGEHVALPLRQKRDDVPLHGVRVLELVHHEVADTLDEIRPRTSSLSRGIFQVEEEVVVVEALRSRSCTRMYSFWRALISSCYSSKVG